MCEKIGLKSSLLSGGLTGLALYLVCGALIYLVPGIAMNLFTSMIHSSVALQVKAFELTSFIVGAIVAFVLGAFLVGVFVFFYNYFSQKK